MFEKPYSEMRWRFVHEAVWRPPTDVYETDDHAIVTVEIAGLNPGDFEISLNGRTLAISGERHGPAEKRAYQQMEIRYGRFRTQVYLPWALDTGNVEATYDQGILRISIRKAHAKRISVEAVESEEA